MWAATRSGGVCDVVTGPAAALDPRCAAAMARMVKLSDALTSVTRWFGLMPSPPADVCRAVAVFGQVVLGFLIPTVALFTWELRSRRKHVGRRTVHCADVVLQVPQILLLMVVFWAVLCKAL